MTKKKQGESAPKERGCWLTGWIILIALHGIIASLLVVWQGRQPYSDSPLWLTILGLLAIADVVAMIAVWYWKRWGLVLYAISTAIGIAIGLVVTRTQLWVFHDILPLVILGYLIKDKWSYFGIGTE